MLRVRVPAKVVWLGEHLVRRTGAIASAVGLHLTVEAHACEGSDRPYVDPSSPLAEPLEA